LYILSHLSSASSQSYPPPPSLHTEGRKVRKERSKGEEKRGKIRERDWEGEGPPQYTNSSDPRSHCEL
jgi:hypothetical protein